MLHYNSTIGHTTYSSILFIALHLNSRILLHSVHWITLHYITLHTLHALHTIETLHALHTYHTLHLCIQHMCVHWHAYCIHAYIQACMHAWQDITGWKGHDMTWRNDIMTTRQNTSQNTTRHRKHHKTSQHITAHHPHTTSRYIRLHWIRYIQTVQINDYITSHNMTLHYIAKHCMPLHTITCHYIPLHTVHTMTCHYIPCIPYTLYIPYVPYIALHYILLHSVAVRYLAIHSIAWHNNMNKAK